MVLDEHDVLAFVRHDGTTRLYCRPIWAWILDGNKWNDAFAARGHEASDFSERHGFLVLDEHTIGAFVSKSARYEVNADVLQAHLLAKLAVTDVWWDVEQLFPKLFIDFDARKLTGCYGSDGHPTYENYVPAGWTSEIEDFMRLFPTTLMPEDERYWIVDGKDVVAGLKT